MRSSTRKRILRGVHVKENERDGITKAFFTVGKSEFLPQSHLHFYYVWEFPFWVGYATKYDEKRGRFHTHKFKVFPQSFGNVIQWSKGIGYDNFIQMTEGTAYGGTTYRRG